MPYISLPNQANTHLFKVLYIFVQHFIYLKIDIYVLLVVACNFGLQDVTNQFILFMRS